MSLNQHLSALKEINAHLYEFGKEVVGALNSLTRQVGVNPFQVDAALDPITAISVTGQNGIFDIQITDKVPRNPGIEYWAEYSTTPDFGKGTTYALSLGASLNAHVFLGNVTLYWRAFPKYATSLPGAPQVFGGATPTAVVGGGTIGGPTFQPSNGSGGGAT